MDSPDLGRICTILCLLLGGYLISLTLYQWQRLRHIPGPFLASFTYAWLAYTGWCGKQDKIYKPLGPKYGPLVRVGPGEVITDDPETIRRISNSKSLYPRSGWYDGTRFTPDRDGLFTMMDPVIHDNHKAKTIHGYSGRETPGVESAIEVQIKNLVSLIRREYVHKPGTTKLVPLDLSKVIPLFALDVISCIAIGKEFGCLQANKDVVGFFRPIEKYLPVLNVFADVPWARRLVFSKIGIKLIGPKPTDKDGLGLIMKLVNTEVRKRYSGDDKVSHDILGSFRRRGLTEAECQAEALFMFIAGTETVSSALRTTLFHLIGTPVAYQRLKAEIKTAVENRTVSSPITAAEAKTLPYLQAVLYEGLRIRPAATATFAKEVPPGGDTIHGYFVPAGTSVGPNLPCMMRSKELFGEDADIFRPERFLEADPDTRTEMQRNVDLVFGYGRWMCAGKTVAWLELNKMIFEVVREFDFQIFDPKEGIKSWSHGAWVDKDIFVVAREADS
ncbi:cytochrome P450 [Xylaria intraflava]|nr:cytochrome P450 [Xylaria intraflava]